MHNGRMNIGGISLRLHRKVVLGEDISSFYAIHMFHNEGVIEGNSCVHFMLGSVILENGVSIGIQEGSPSFYVD